MDKSLINELMKTSVSSSFHRATKIVKFGVHRALGQSNPAVLNKNTYKAYPRFPQYILPIPTSPSGKIIDLLTQRRSIRDFVRNPIVLSDFSNLIYYSAGSTIFFHPNDRDRRFYPSAGAKYPLEVYPFIFSVDTIPVGGYHYHVKTHSLEKVLDDSFAKQIFEYFDQDWLRQSAVIIVITAVFNRTETKYGDRGYRHILTEYGHMAQNMYLISQLLGIGCCSIGGFIDEGINRLLDLDYEDEAVVGVVAVGKS